MLLELHVRNLALIERADIEFGAGLNILTGETGAGKSIVIGSVTTALGGKATKDSIRPGAGSAQIELVFSVDSARAAALREMGIEPDENGLVIVTRKIGASRSTGRINDEAVTTAKLKQATGLLLDVHGQHEHQSLLYKQKHLEILDSYIREKSQPLKQSVEKEYRTWSALKERLSGLSGDAGERRREADFLRFEIGEIESAALKEGEEEELMASWRRLSHARMIAENVGRASDALDGDVLSEAIRALGEAAAYDKELEGTRNELIDAEAILGDVARELNAYLDSLEIDEESLARTGERLDVIRALQAKYGRDVKEIHRALAQKKKRLDALDHYNENKAKTEKALKESEARLNDLCEKLSLLRREAAKGLVKEVSQGLCDLNFLDVAFEMEFARSGQFGANGFDEAQFMISTNPGQPLRPLKDVASGGELSRIMLAIKTVLADTDEIPTLIFDEIDTGISGRTAQKVSEKLATIASGHQVICITHLPQIAAMADEHFEIKKSVSDGVTSTEITLLDEEASVRELARLLGGAKITQAVLDNAREMKDLAYRLKKENKENISAAKENKDDKARNIPLPGRGQPLAADA